MDLSILDDKLVSAEKNANEETTSVISILDDKPISAEKVLNKEDTGVISILKNKLAIFWKSINKENMKKLVKSPVFWARFAAYAIPLAFLGYVLYMNFLPFGYNQTFVINVGGADDTKVGEFYLEPAKSLSDKKVAPDGTHYRELKGSAFAIFKPKAILKDAEVTVFVEGDPGVSLIPPIINFDPSAIQWDYAWDFNTHSTSSGQAEIPKDLTGNAFMFDGAIYFDGKSRLELPNSADKFEDRAFTLYAEWEPRDAANNAQQIVGHYNWELWQNKENVEFRVGRMNGGTGPAYSIKYPITTTFFNKKHTATAIYNPADNGYIDLFIDGALAGRTYFHADKIWKDYGNKNITFGKSSHGSANYFNGTVYKVNIVSKNILEPQAKISFKVKNNNPINISIIATTASTLKQLKLNVTQR